MEYRFDIDVEVEDEDSSYDEPNDQPFSTWDDDNEDDWPAEEGWEGED